MTNSLSRNASSSSGNDRRKASSRQSRKHIQLEAQGPFSDGVLLGNTLYLSGRIGLDECKQIPADIEAEAHNVMESVRIVLQKASMRMEDLVYVQVFCSDVSLWERFNTIYASYFSGKMPARAFVGSGPLLFGAHFEVQGIAIKAD